MEVLSADYVGPLSCQQQQFAMFAFEFHQAFKHKVAQYIAIE